MTFKYNKPKHNDERTKTRFAWLPVSCWDGETLVTKWLEKVTTRQRWIELPAHSHWSDEQFIFENGNK